MEDQWQVALAYLIVLVGVAELFGRTFGSALEGLNEAVIRAFNVPSHLKPAVNYGISIALTATATVVLAAAIGHWSIVPGSVLVGLMLANAAAKEHDLKAENPPTIP